MKASAISNALRTLVAARQPVFIWGGPGIGKSAVVRQLAQLMKIPRQDVRALLLDPVDLRGLPFLSDGRSKWATPDFLPQDGSGILLLDELNAAPAMVQASCYHLVLDRKLGEYTLPKDWAIVAAGNRDSDRAVTTRMPTPLRARLGNHEAIRPARAALASETVTITFQMRHRLSSQPSHISRLLTFAFQTIRQAIQIR